MPQATAPAAKVPWAARFARAAALRLVLLGSGLLVALLLAEVAVRLLSDEGPGYTFRDAEVGRRFTRSWEGDCYVEEVGRAVHMRFNREGMRDRDWPTAKPAGQLRVAVLGDSMVAALATEEGRRFTSGFGRSWPRGSESGSSVHLVASDGSDAAEVLNWGVAGSSPALAVRLFETRALHYGCDAVVLVWFIGNDLSDDWQPLGGRRAVAADLDERGALRWLPYAESSSALSEWLARNSRFYVWQKRMLARLGREDASGPRPGLRALEVGDDPVLADAWRMAEAVLTRFAASTRSAGALPLLLVLPSAEQVYDDLWEHTAAAASRTLVRWQPQERLERVAAQLGLRAMSERFLDGLRLERSTDHVFLGGTGHLNDRGHQIVRARLENLVAQAIDARELGWK